jgi:SAM-dependent methyltransferase
MAAPATAPARPDADAKLADLLRALRGAGYRFVPPTPETHRRVLDRNPGQTARDLRDVFGWSLDFDRDVVPESLFDLIDAADMVEAAHAGRYRSLIRVASVGDRLFLHSAYPTDERDSVFFGPDSYRFARFLASELGSGGRVRRLVDIGAGGGVGAIVAAGHLPGARLTLTDVNPLALRFARINARDAGLDVELVRCSGMQHVAGPFDLAIANPPFIVDPASRAYRDGGDMHGAALSLEWTLEAARRVAPGGRVLLYTGSAIVGGEDRLERALRAQLPALGCTLRYEEIDPDIFGEQLAEPGYEEVERIAAVGAVVEKQ